MTELQHAIVLAPRGANYSRADFQLHYEAFHAPLFYSFGKVGVGRYVRNHVARVIGADPPFDTISEFGNDPGKRAELIAALRSPEAKILEDDVQTFLAERGNVFNVTETLVAGPPRGFERGPVAKRMILLTRPVAARDYADAIAALLGDQVIRIVLTVWDPEPTPPMGAMIAIWPAAGAALADSIGSLPAADVRYVLDVESYCTAWRD